MVTGCACLHAHANSQQKDDQRPAPLQNNLWSAVCAPWETLKSTNNAVSTASQNASRLCDDVCTIAGAAVALGAQGKFIWNKALALRATRSFSVRRRRHTSISTVNAIQVYRESQSVLPLCTLHAQLWLAAQAEAARPRTGSLPQL